MQHCVFIMNTQELHGYSHIIENLHEGNKTEATLSRIFEFVSVSVSGSGILLF